MSSQRIILVSKESFRMYNAMCPEESGKKKSKKRREWIFSTRTPAFFLAAALGIINVKIKEVKKERQLTRREYIVNHKNFEAFNQLLKSKYNLKTEREVIEKLTEFAEAGINDLYDEYHKTGKINFLQIYRNVKSRF